MIIQHDIVACLKSKWYYEYIVFQKILLKGTVNLDITTTSIAVSGLMDL